MANDTTRSMERNRDRSDIRMFEIGYGIAQDEYSEYSEKIRRETESERLVNIAKKNGLFLPLKDIRQIGMKHGYRSGESVVYLNPENNRVYKIKDPYAKLAIKRGVMPEDAIYEHLVHNYLFPEVKYTFEGISEEMGDVRIVLSQEYIESVVQPTREQVVTALAQRGLVPEDDYSFGNEYVSVTDVEGDNTLIGADGKLYFIDPIIRFKKTLKEILEFIG